MTREILEKYIEYRKMRLYKGDANSTQVFMPFLIMDCAYQLFSKSLFRDVKAYRHEKKKWLKFINMNFCNFFTKFNWPFTEADLDVISEDQDAFFDYTKTERTHLRTALINGCRRCGVSPDDQPVLADSHIVNILASCAAVFWEDTFHSVSVNKGDKNKEIEGIRYGTRQFSDAYLPGDVVLSDEDTKAVNEAKTALCEKIADFLMTRQEI